MQFVYYCWHEHDVMAYMLLVIEKPGDRSARSESRRTRRCTTHAALR